MRRREAPQRDADQSPKVAEHAFDVLLRYVVVGLEVQLLPPRGQALFDRAREKLRSNILQLAHQALAFVIIPWEASPGADSIRAGACGPGARRAWLSTSSASSITRSTTARSEAFKTLPFSIRFGVAACASPFFFTVDDMANCYLT
jgi:hypothetical protein